MDTQIKIDYDTAFGEDDEMSQTDIHNALIAYLMDVFAYLFAGQYIGIFTSIQLYGDPQNPSRHRSPDVLVIDNFMSGPDHEITAYTIDEAHVAPRVLVEISSEGNWVNDLEEKHDIYERMRVPEYFACDPHIERIWTGAWATEPRLIGWRYNQLLGGYVRIPEEPRGLWSEQLHSYLNMDGYANRQLHLYDHAGNRRLTEAEAAQQQVLQEQTQRLLAEQQAQMAEQQAEQERNQRLLAEQQSKLAEQQAEYERNQRLLAEQRAKETEEQLLRLQQQLEELRRKAGQNDQSME